MERITSTDAVGVQPAASESGTTGYFTDGDPGVPTPATTVTAAWLNRMQEEVCGLIEYAGLTLDANDDTQLRQAVEILSAATLRADGSILQSAHASTSSNFNVTAITPVDNTIPQNTEGTEILTCSITPSDAANYLLVEVSVPYYLHSLAGGMGSGVLHLHQDSTANAFHAMPVQLSVAATESAMNGVATLRYVITAGTTSATTIKLRAGRGGVGQDFEVNYATYSLGSKQAVTMSVYEIKAP